MSYKNLPKEVKKKLLDEVSGGSGGDEKLLILERQNGFVEEFVRKKKITLLFDGSLNWRQYPQISREVFLTKVQQEYRIFATTFKIASPNRLSRLDLHHQFKELLYESRADKLLRLGNVLRFNPEAGQSELDRFVGALFPEGNTEHLFFAKKVFECFIWQVKRKIAGIPVEHHIMPVLYSKKHGTGKSVSVARLVDPLKEFTLHLQLDVFRDSFFRKAFSENYVVVFDELQGAGRTDIDSMKNVITADTLSARGMRTQEVDTIPQNCTFIGTSNRPLTDMIFDNTGMRRFVELELDCKANLELITGEKWVDGERQKVSKPIDFLKVWRSVSELGLNPILAIKESLDEHQEGLRTKSTVEQWLEDAGVEPGDVPNDVNTLYNHYKQWIEFQDKRPGMILRFKKELVSLGLSVSDRKVVKGKRGYFVGLACDIGGLKT